MLRFNTPRYRRRRAGRETAECAKGRLLELQGELAFHDAGRCRERTCRPGDLHGLSRRSWASLTFSARMRRPSRKSPDAPYLPTAGICARHEDALAAHVGQGGSTLHSAGAHGRDVLTRTYPTAARSCPSVAPSVVGSGVPTVHRGPSGEPPSLAQPPLPACPPCANDCAPSPFSCCPLPLWHPFSPGSISSCSPTVSINALLVDVALAPPSCRCSSLPTARYC